MHFDIKTVFEGAYIVISVASGRFMPDLRQNVVAAINELMTEMRNMRDIIREHAKETIHAK